MKAQEHKYEGETFSLLMKDCYTEVWLDEEVRYVGPATNCTKEVPYGVSDKLTNGRLGWTPFNAYKTLVDGVNGACQQLLRSRAEKSLNFEAACKQMHEEFEKLP